MRAIKHVLTERFYVWEDAVKLAEKDPEVNLSGDGPAFTPIEYLEKDETAGGPEQQQQQQQQEAVAEAAEAAGKTTEKAEPASVAAPDPATIPSSKPPGEAPRL